MELSNREKYIFKIIFISLLSILCFIALFGGIKNQNIDLQKKEKIFGIVENFETEIHTRSKGRKSKDFYIKLVGFHKKLKVGRVLENYDDLFGILKKEDSLTIYYDEIGNDFSVIEIQRKNEILLSKSEYEKRESIIAIIGIVGIISCISIIYDVRKKYREELKSGS
jgi:hypothetical protein